MRKVDEKFGKCLESDMKKEVTFISFEKFKNEKKNTLFS